MYFINVKIKKRFSQKSLTEIIPHLKDEVTKILQGFLLYSIFFQNPVLRLCYNTVFSRYDMYVSGNMSNDVNQNSPKVVKRGILSD